MALIEDFPVAGMGEVAQSPEVMPLDWELQLAGGREIFLTRIQQHRTYGGMLCGLPRDPERTVAEAVNASQEWDRHFHGAPVVIPATIVSGTKTAPKDPRFAQLGPTAWSMLPQVTTFAEFQSLSPARDQSEVYSSALVVWWQGQFGIPRDADLLQRLRSIDWVRYARDWMP
jgi:hypothetical protein